MTANWSSIKKMVSKIMEAVYRIVPEGYFSHERNGEGILVVNEQLMLACRIKEDAEGYYCLVIFDQITGSELRTHQMCFPNPERAIAEARKLVDACGLEIIREIARGETVFDLEEDRVLAHVM